MPRRITTFIRVEVLKLRVAVNPDAGTRSHISSGHARLPSNRPRSAVGWKRRISRGKHDMSENIRNGTPVEIWQALVQDANQRTGIHLDESSESYLVFVLLRYQADNQLLSHAQGMDWLRALEQVGSARTDALRDVGDRCLLVAGLFPGLAERRRVSVDYFIAIGRSAYQGVAEATRLAYAALYAGLACHYGELVGTLNAVRPLPTAPSAIRPLR